MLSCVSAAAVAVLANGVNICRYPLLSNNNTVQFTSVMTAAARLTVLWATGWTVQRWRDPCVEVKLIIWQGAEVCTSQRSIALVAPLR